MRIAVLLILVELLKQKKVLSINIIFGIKEKRNTCICSILFFAYNYSYAGK